MTHVRRHPADSHTFKDGRKIILRNQTVLVKMDPDEEATAGGIIKPQGATDHIFMTGTVLAFGWILERKLPGTSKTKPLKEPYPVPELEAGIKCCFIRYRRWQDTNKQLRMMFDDDVIALEPEDLLFVFPAGMDIELGQ